MNGDQGRWLGPSGGYVTSPARAMAADRLEAVSEDEQEHQTEQSHRRALDARIARREATAAELEQELRWHESRVRFLGRELRRLRRPVT